MAFAGINYWAILVAAIAGWVLGAAWYIGLAKPWMTALGVSREEMDARKREPGAFLPFIYALVALLVMAWVLAGIMGHLGRGQVTLRNGAVSGAFCWLGFVLTAMVTNYSFGRRKPMLLVIDAGHWLAVLVLMGAIIGAFGV
jgi:hypothetical protein